tara:strand:- start:306 stop:782 length:477 start_codon:yes stop_codon:yes gene_type:complete
LAQNKFNYDLDAVKQLAEVLVEHDLSEIEYNKDISKDQRIHIKIAKSLKLNTAFSKEKIKEVSEKAADTNIEEVEKPTGDESTTLKSPMVGTVYLSPDPNSEPFVKVGDMVNEGQPILIIEAMKTMNHIPAPKAGIVKSIIVKNGSPVEFGDPLILIE